MVRIRWPNGVRDSADSFDQLFDWIRMVQWQEMSDQEFRQEMARRAKVWSDTHINVSGSTEQFFRELERARLLMIEDPGVK